MSMILSGTAKLLLNVVLITKINAPLYLQMYTSQQYKPM